MKFLHKQLPLLALAFLSLIPTGCLVSPVAQSGGIGSITVSNSNPDAIIAADLAVLAHMADRHPGARLHLSVQAAASTPEAIRFYAEAYGVRRVVLPRVLSVEEIAALTAEIDVETEAFGFGGLCVMAEGRCLLSSYATGKSPNLSGACSPPSHLA